MSVGSSIFQRSAAMAALVVCLGWFVAKAGDPLRPDQSIIFSAPKAGVLTTNFNQLDLDSTKLDDNFPTLHPFSRSSSGGSLSPVPARPAGIGNSGVRNLLDGKDWVFTTPDEVMQSYMSSEIFGNKTSDKDEKSQGRYSNMELYYLRMSQGRTNSAARNSSSRSGQFGDDSRGDSNPFATISSGTARMNSDNSLAPVFQKPPEISDLFGVSKRADPVPVGAAFTGTEKFRQTQESQIEQFKKLLNPTPSPGGASGIASYPNSFSSMPTASIDTGQRSAANPLVGMARPATLAPQAPGRDDFLPHISSPQAPTAPGQSVENSRSPSTARARPVEPSFQAPLRAF